jgi:hypothetical protein
VAVEEPDEFRPDVAGRTDDPDADPLTRFRTAVHIGREPWLQARAHGRAKPFAEGCLWPGRANDRTAVMSA